MTRCMLKITGRVQGVGYRYWAEKTAISLGLRGWVCNCPDGSVQCLVEGGIDQVEEFKKLAWAGPPAASVDSVDPLPVPPSVDELKKFRITKFPP